jgi:5-methylcytosine-specific restriction enzyme subunit McrC
VPAEIPIRNIYYLLCYAWNTLDEGGLVEVSHAGRNELADLFARILSGATRHLLRRGLDRGYVPQQEELRALRGRALVTASLKTLGLPQGKVVCEFDEFQRDILNNQILKSTIVRLARVDELHDDLRGELARLLRHLADVNQISPTRAAFRQVQLHLNNGFYRFLLNVCELVHECLLPDPEGRRYRFRDFLRDERKMADLFQKFVFHFFRLEQRIFPSVKVDRIAWNLRPGDQKSEDALPTMLSDVTLRSRTRTLIVDTKYYVRPLDTRFDSEKLRAEHLYQLFAYVKNVERHQGSDIRAEGILLYPTVGRDFDFAYWYEGHHIRARTVNLNQEWPAVSRDLLAVLSEPDRVASER